jgi:predicted metal-dependent phosphoesterase TrpH
VKYSLPLKIDLHMHTHYSEDSTNTLKDVIRAAREQGLNAVAITDHETTMGAQRLAKQKKLLVIPGIEIETRRGHVLGLNVKEPIASKLALIETTEKIHESGGIAVIAHPATFLKTGLGQIVEIGSGVDAVEVINSASFPFFVSTYLARRLSRRLGLPETAGSDAHYPNEIGRAYTLVEANSNLDDIIEAIRKGETVPIGRPISWLWRIQRGASGVREKIRGR